MGVTIDGNNITITNATLQIVNGNNAESGVAYIIITPDGGVGMLPFMAQGLPGQPTLFPSIQYVQLPAGATLPTPNPAVTLIDAGGAGLPAKYALTFYGNQGEDGVPGAFNIVSAADLAATPALGIGTDKFVLVYRNSDSKWVPTAQKVGDCYVSSLIAATANDTTNPRLLSSIAIPAQPWAWRPRPFAQCPVTGSADTRVDLYCRIDDPAAGAQVGYSRGRVGTAPPTNILIPAMPADSSGYGIVAANTAATIHLRAEQVAPSSNAWSTPANPETTYQVEVQPIP